MYLSSIFLFLFFHEKKSFHSELKYTWWDGYVLVSVRKRMEQRHQNEMKFMNHRHYSTHEIYLREKEFLPPKRYEEKKNTTTHFTHSSHVGYRLLLFNRLLSIFLVESASFIRVENFLWLLLSAYCGTHFSAIWFSFCSPCESRCMSLYSLFHRWAHAIHQFKIHTHNVSASINLVLSSLCCQSCQRIRHLKLDFYNLLRCQRTWVLFVFDFFRLGNSTIPPVALNFSHYFICESRQSMSTR